MAKSGTVLIHSLSNTFSGKFEAANEGPFISYSKDNKLNDLLQYI